MHFQVISSHKKSLMEDVNQPTPNTLISSLIHLILSINVWHMDFTVDIILSLIRERHTSIRYIWSSPHLGFSSSDGPGFDGSSLIEPGQYLGDAAMGDQELSGDVAGSDTHESKLHDPPPNIVRQRSSIDEDSSELIDSSLTWQYQR